MRAKDPDSQHQLSVCDQLKRFFNDDADADNFAASLVKLIDESHGCFSVSQKRPGWGCFWYNLSIATLLQCFGDGGTLNGYNVIEDFCLRAKTTGTWKNKAVVNLCCSWRSVVKIFDTFLSANLLLNSRPNSIISSGSIWYEGKRRLLKRQNQLRQLFVFIFNKRIIALEINMFLYNI